MGSDDGNVVVFPVVRAGRVDNPLSDAVRCVQALRRATDADALLTLALIAFRAHRALRALPMLEPELRRAVCEAPLDAALTAIDVLRSRGDAAAIIELANAVSAACTILAGDALPVA